MITDKEKQEKEFPQVLNALIQEMSLNQELHLIDIYPDAYYKYKLFTNLCNEAQSIEKKRNQSTPLSETWYIC